MPAPGRTNRKSGYPMNNSEACKNEQCITTPSPWIKCAHLLFSTAGRLFLLFAIKNSCKLEEMMHPTCTWRSFIIGMPFLQFIQGTRRREGEGRSPLLFPRARNNIVHIVKPLDGYACTYHRVLFVSPSVTVSLCHSHLRCNKSHEMNYFTKDFS